MSALPGFWESATQQQRDDAYDNTRAVADSAALIAARNAAAEAFRASHPAGLDRAFGATEREAWDLFPGRDAGAPCLAFIHGGYWQRNRRQDFSHYAEGALAMGWSFAAIGYTLAPEASLTTIVAQVHAGLDWLAAHGAAEGIGGPIIVCGWSAGGHLTAMAVSHPGVTAGLAISGIFELAPIRDTNLNEKLRLTEKELDALSPQRLPVVPKPLHVAYGSAELPELVRQSRDFHARRAASHAAGSLVPVPGADHFRIMEELRHPCSTLMQAAASLLPTMRALGRFATGEDGCTAIEPYHHERR
jgi:acetyl esterase/lipase